MLALFYSYQTHSTHAANLSFLDPGVEMTSRDANQRAYTDGNRSEVTLLLLQSHPACQLLKSFGSTAVQLLRDTLTSQHFTPSSILSALSS